MHQDWKTQNIVATGAASALDRAICMRFVRFEATVRGIDINKAPLDEMETV